MALSSLNGAALHAQTLQTAKLRMHALLVQLPFLFAYTCCSFLVLACEHYAVICALYICLDGDRTRLSVMQGICMIF